MAEIVETVLTKEVQQPFSTHPNINVYKCRIAKINEYRVLVLLIGSYSINKLLEILKNVDEMLVEHSFL